MGYNLGLFNSLLPDKANFSYKSVFMLLKGKKRCPVCYSEVHRNALVCPFCHHRFTKKEPEEAT
jgi:rRNA maturation endonuclease Nob1